MTGLIHIYNTCICIISDGFNFFKGGLPENYPMNSYNCNANISNAAFAQLRGISYYGCSTLSSNNTIWNGYVYNVKNVSYFIMRPTESLHNTWIILMQNTSDDRLFPSN